MSDQDICTVKGLLGRIKALWIFVCSSAYVCMVGAAVFSSADKVLLKMGVSLKEQTGKSTVQTGV